MIRNNRILIVEDEPNDVQLILKALEEFDLHERVVIVGDGVEALDYLFRTGKYKGTKDQRPDVILLDKDLPLKNGLDVLKTIKADEFLKTIPVVMLTSSTEEKDILESYKLRVNAYVVKPMDMEKFKQAVGEIGRFWKKINEPPPGL